MSSGLQVKPCKLCGSCSETFWLDELNHIPYSKCKVCCSIFQTGNTYLSFSQEKERYLMHNNDVNDLGYQGFVSPITNSIQSFFKPDVHNGLDFGCGTGPVISHMLKQHGFHVTLYDPFFYPDMSYLSNKYDFIICCEVMEHFHRPQEEFKKLRNLLKPKGILFCKTSIVNNDMSVDSFSKWYYKNDPTHVFFYSPKGLKYIKDTFEFSQLVISENLITFIV